MKAFQIKEDYIKRHDDSVQKLTSDWTLYCKTMPVKQNKGHSEALRKPENSIVKFTKF